MRRSRAIAAIALVALAVACTGAKPEGPCSPDGLLGEGDPIPSGCTLPALGEGEDLNLADLGGKPAVINFWASWCTFCLKEMPAFERVHKALGEQVTFIGADLVGIDGETEELGGTYAKDRGVTYRLIVDAEGLLYSHFVLTSATRTPVLPTTILVRADGRIAHRTFGPMEEKDLREAIRTKLGVS